MRSDRLTVEREGVLTLPAEVCAAARLRPGDILSIQPSAESFVLEIYRDLLDGALEHMDDQALLGFAIRFLSRPLTTLEPGGHLRIPAEVFPLPAGCELLLFVDQTATGRWMQVFREA
ncbi:MAG TPA: hypothetical protein VFR31_13860 [Thermoanaerobaculia bacterium]|nr:hypothetical protein [Thermoanaerobaculia bacterium]